MKKFGIIIIGLVLGCATETVPALIPQSTVDVEATVQARLEEERKIDDIVATRVAEERSSEVVIKDSTPVPPTPVPPTPVPPTPVPPTPVPPTPVPAKTWEDVIEEALKSTVRILTSEGSGTGSIIKTNFGNGNAAVVTNYHVITNQKDITVIIHNKKEYDAEILYKNELLDLAILQICCDYSLVPIKLTTSTRRFGQEVAALGYPETSTPKVTKGVISSPEDENGFIQTDAALNPGNSGGPLINFDGAQVGVNTMAKRFSWASLMSIEGVGWAVPSEKVESILDQLFLGGNIPSPLPSPTPTPIPTPTPNPYPLVSDSEYKSIWIAESMNDYQNQGASSQLAREVAVCTWDTLISIMGYSAKDNQLFMKYPEIQIRSNLLRWADKLREAERYYCGL